MSQCSVPSLKMLNTEQAEIVQRQGSWDAPRGHVHLVKKHISFSTPLLKFNCFRFGSNIKSRSRCLLKGRLQQQADQFP